MRLGRGQNFDGKRVQANRHQRLHGINDNKDVLLASDGGYGFVGKLSDLVSKNKAGKAVLKPSKGGLVMPPLEVANYDEDLIVAISNEGRMLMFPLRELPRLAKGKGNKILGIPPARVAERVEFVVAIAVLGAQDSITIHAGKRHHNLRPADLEHYAGERGRRGNKLPRGFQNVDSIEVVPKAVKASEAER